MAMISCPECGSNISDKAVSCPYCGCPSSEWRAQAAPEPQHEQYVQHVQPVQQVQPEPVFNGIYRVSLFGKQTPIYCPRCGSDNCEWFVETKTIAAKTKTRYTANLNPLKPFTLVNKKKKVIRPEQNIVNKKIMCRNCGCTFY